MSPKRRPANTSRRRPPAARPTPKPDAEDASVADEADAPKAAPQKKAAPRKKAAPQGGTTAAERATASERAAAFEEAVAARKAAKKVAETAPTSEDEPPEPEPAPAEEPPPSGSWIRTTDRRDRITGGLLALGVLGDLFAALHYGSEIAKLHKAADAGLSISPTILDPADAIPAVWVLLGLELAFAITFGVVAVAVLRNLPFGRAAIRTAAPILLPIRLLAFLAGYVRLQDYLDGTPGGTRDPEYHRAVGGEVLGSGIAAGALVIVLLIGVGYLSWRWYGPAGRVARPRPTSPRGLAVARATAMVGVVLALVVPVAWTNPVGANVRVPSEWSIIGLLSGALVILLLAAVALTLAVRPERPILRAAATGFVAVVTGLTWLVTLWQWFYAEEAYGPNAVDGVRLPWTAAVVAGLASCALLTVTATALSLVPSIWPEPPPGPTTRKAAMGR